MTALTVKRVGLLYREPFHSTGDGGNDRRILDAVADRLRDLGCAVDELPTATDGIGYRLDVDLVLSMSRTIEVLNALCSANEGPPIMNNPRATALTLRERLYRIFDEDGAPFPDTKLVPLEDCEAHPTFPYWLKRCDYHHVAPDDVSLVVDGYTQQRACRHFLRQGHRYAIAQRHIDGKRIKFYGVFDPDRSELLFLRTLEDAPPPLVAKIEELVGRLLQRIPLQVFGGDVLCDGEQLLIVDFNSWPSFKSCLETAASAIASYAMRLAG